MGSKWWAYMLNVSASMVATAMCNAISVAAGWMTLISNNQAVAIAVLSGICLVIVTALQFAGPSLVERWRRRFWIVRAEMKVLQDNPRTAVRVEIELSEPNIAVNQVTLTVLCGESLYLDSDNAEISVSGSMVVVHPRENVREKFQAIGKSTQANRVIRVEVSTFYGKAQSAGLVYCASDR